MLPAPARAVSRPRQRSRTCWNPAVPPPPVAGAAAGKGLADGLGDGDGLALGVVALGVVGLGLGVVALAVGVVGLAVLVSEAVGVAGGVPPGENAVGADEGGLPPVQAETDRETNIVKTTQPKAVPRKRRWP
jgi:hypothetical protein